MASLFSLLTRALACPDWFFTFEYRFYNGCKEKGKKKANSCIQSFQLRAFLRRTLIYTHFINLIVDPAPHFFFTLMIVQYVSLYLPGIENVRIENRVVSSIKFNRMKLQLMIYNQITGDQWKRTIFYWKGPPVSIWRLQMWELTFNSTKWTHTKMWRKKCTTKNSRNWFFFFHKYKSHVISRRKRWQRAHFNG